MSNQAELELQMAGYRKVYDYTQFAHENHINVIPKEAVGRLIEDTFRPIAQVLKETYGPYGSSNLLMEGNETTSTKDGFKVFENLAPNHTYKKMVYNTISKIIKRVNKNVGDGTTSCILIADKIFRNLKEIIKTSDDRRQMVTALEKLTEYLQSNDMLELTKTRGMVEDLDKKTLKKLMLVSANYDEQLVDALFKALDPQLDENGNVTALRNVVPSSEIATDITPDNRFTLEYLPGDFRVCVRTDYDNLVKFADKRELRVILYDHNMTPADAVALMEAYDDQPTLVLSFGYTSMLRNEAFAQYINKKAFNKKAHSPNSEINLFFMDIQGYYKLNDVNDLAFLLGTTPRTIFNTKIDDIRIYPTAEVSLYHGDCLAFHGLKGNVDTSEYIKRLQMELEIDDKKSITRVKNYNNRINALKMDVPDTLMTVKCSSSMEAQLIMDKIDDCISIATSAQASGIVPNLFKYGKVRLDIYRDNLALNNIDNNVENSIEARIVDAIIEAIYGIFADIYESKYGVDYSWDKFIELRDAFYEKHGISYNVITDQFVDMREIPTSAQYDLEVLVAVLEIVKYLLTPGAIIFDAHILKPVDDEGHYQS